MSRPGWSPDPPMVGIRSPIGLVVGSCTSHPGVLGSIPKREEPGKTGAPCVKVPGSSRVPAPPWMDSRSPDGWDQIPRWAGGWVLHQPPLSFGFDSQTREPAPPWVGSRSPDGWDHVCVFITAVPITNGSDPPMGWWLGLAPATLE